MPLISVLDGAGRPVPVQAEVVGLFAVHQTLTPLNVRYQARFMVSHVPTRHLLIGWLTYDAAMGAAHAFASSAVPWEADQKSAFTQEHRTEWNRIKALYPSDPPDDDEFYPLPPEADDNYDTIRTR